MGGLSNKLRGLSGGEIENQTAATTAPTVNDDNTKGYTFNSAWFDSSAGKLYILVDETTGAAIWVPVNGENYKGSWNASTNIPLLADGVGTVGDNYLVSVAGSQNLGSGTIAFVLGDLIIYDGTIWKKGGISYTPEDVANKSTDGTMAANSATLYPSQSAVVTYASAKVADSITDGVTTVAPSQNAVFDAFALKQNTSAKDASGGYAGLTLFKINFKNALNTFTSFFTNANTAARTYTFQDRDGTILDSTDLTAINTSIGNKQDSNSNLTSLASLTLPANGLLYSTANNTITTTTLTPAARTVLDDTTVDAMINTLAGATSSGTGGLVRITGSTLINPALGTPSALVGTNITGTATGLSIGGNAATATTATTANTVTTNANLTGDVTSVGNNTTLTNAPVIAKVLTGYLSGAGIIDATDSILSAIQKLNGNDATNANLTGAVTSVGNAASLGSFTSAELLTALSTKTGTGDNVFATSPTLITPALGTPASGNLGNCVGYASVNLPTGTCLKVVSTTKLDTASTTSSTYAAITGLSATITPVNSSSKILVRVILAVGGSNLTKANFQLFRDTTQIGGGNAPGFRTSDSAVFVSSGGTIINTVAIEFSDSPATSSAVVYSVKWSSPDNVSTMYLNRAFTDTSSVLVSRTISTITLQEFKG